jgi:hypothetical protein
MDDLVLEYQKTKQESLFRKILEALRPGLSSWCKTEDEKQIARLAVWQCALSWRPGPVMFPLYVKISVQRRLFADRRRTVATVPYEEEAVASGVESLVLAKQVFEQLSEVERRVLAREPRGLTRQGAALQERAVLLSLRRWALDEHGNRRRRTFRSYRTQKTTT